MKTTATALALTIALALPAAAQEAEHLGNFGDWSAFTTQEGGKTICYMASNPTKEEGQYDKRGDAYTMVTHRPAEKLLDEVNLHQGYTLKKGSEVIASIGGTSFNLFTDGGRAWAYENKDDRALVLAMKRGNTMTVRGTSWRGTATKDTYSLKGFTAAYKAINKACGVK